LAAFSSCSWRPQSDQLAAAARDQDLTPDVAKKALLEMMRSKPARDLGWFDGDVPDKMSEMTIEEQEEGWYSWTGAFRFNPSEGKYWFVVRPRPEARVCTFEYKGSFVNTDGRWVATVPALVRTMMPAIE
jgi:hypothetical protein